MLAYPGQANVLDFTVLASDGTAIVAGTVNVYLYCKSGTNVGKWYRGADLSWQAAESIAGTATVKGTMGMWIVSLPSAVWELHATYSAYAYEAVTPSVPVAVPVDCVAKGVSLQTETIIVETP